MSIEKVHILPTDNTPEVFLNPDGIIKVKGRGMVVNKTRVPEQINDWLDAYLLNPAETTDVIVAFEYLNSYSTTILASVLKKISQVVLHNKKFVIHWYYEADDDDILDRGEYISESLNMPIEFIVINDINAC
ncbi:MAG: SiaC family regulatory phosphoprotein [Bacteroidales bacterium]|nr:SiaC family regulatory phosphoprotein [Bacteroidales bacterium]